MQDYIKTSSPIAKREYGDCVVRSLAVGFGISYEESHKICREYLGRKNACGVKGFVTKMSNPDFLNMLENQYGIKLKPHDVSYKDKEGNSKHLYVRKFIEQNPTGKFIISGKNHAWVIDNGEVKDWPSFKNKIYREIRGVFEVISQGQLSLF
jgi:hypothetical protein